jgi:transposase InsO family protein
MTAQLVTDALVMAIWRRGKPDALLHHSHRGSQYTSEQFQKLMADHGVVCSMSRSGNVWDNAVMESFFSSLKTACRPCLDWFPSDASGFRLRNRIALLAAVPVSINFSKLCPEQKYLG